ncbi:MAG: hypothetical protein AAFX99_24010, partial [Myxococcota bacterium]
QTGIDIEGKHTMNVVAGLTFSYGLLTSSLSLQSSYNLMHRIERDIPTSLREDEAFLDIINENRFSVLDNINGGVELRVGVRF